jgi:hypothetical protein
MEVKEDLDKLVRQSDHFIFKTSDLFNTAIPDKNRLKVLRRAAERWAAEAVIRQEGTYTQAARALGVSVGTIRTIRSPEKKEPARKSPGGRRLRG